MTPDAAYQQALAQFQACLAGAADQSMQVLGLCGWSAGYAYGENATLQAVAVWQLAAGVGWLAAVAFALLSVVLVTRPAWLLR